MPRSSFSLATWLGRSVDPVSPRARVRWIHREFMTRLHPPGDFDGVALPIVGGNELGDEAFGVNPTQSVVAEAELSGVVGEDDGAGEPILGADRAPQRAFAGCAHGIGGHPQFGQAERAQMRPPIGFTGEFEDLGLAERFDDAMRQIGRVHIGQGRRIDRVARRPAQEVA